MSDERLRALERRWNETGAGADRQRYALELKRAARYSDVTDLYQPLLEGRFTCELRNEYLEQSAVSLDQRYVLNILLQEITGLEMQSWIFGTILDATSTNLEIVIRDPKEIDSESALPEHIETARIIHQTWITAELEERLKERHPSFNYLEFLCSSSQPNPTDGECTSSIFFSIDKNSYNIQYATQPPTIPRRIRLT